MHSKYSPYLINFKYDVFKFPNRVCIEYRLISKKGEGTFSEVLKA